MSAPLESLTVEQLKRRLREVGLPNSGKRAVLISRMQSYINSQRFESANEQSLRDRIGQLEEMVESLRIGREQMPPPICASSPTIALGGNACAPITQRATPRNEQRVQFDTRGAYMTANEYGDDRRSDLHTTLTTATPGVPLVSNANVRTHVPETSNEQQQHQVFRPINDDQVNMGVFMNVHDIKALLPKFDPLKGEITATQFLSRIEQLRQVYRWNDRLLLFATQANLEGVAKTWADSYPRVFTTWYDFVSEFRVQFPTTINTADVHMKLMQTGRNRGEDVVSYYYRVMAIARKGGIDELATIKYIINGINDEGLKRSVSVRSYNTCQELLLACQNYCSYNSIEAKAAQPVRQNVYKPQTTQENVKDKARSVDEKQRNNIICYKCRKPGHISRNCRLPPQGEPCTKCNKHGHVAADCRVTRNATCNKINNVCNKLVIKTVKVGDIEACAMIDSGSECSLVRVATASKLGPFLPCNTTITGFGGKIIECSYKVVAEIIMDDVVSKSELLIVTDDSLEYDLLIGNDILCMDDKLVIIAGGKCAVSKILVNENAQNKLNNLLMEFSGRFSTDISTLGKCKTTKMKIELTSAEPIKMKPYRTPFARRPIIQGIIDELLQVGIISHSTSPYASPALLVPKKNNVSRQH